VTEVSQAIGVSRQTVYNYLAELEEAGRISRNNGTVRILETSHERG
jgi:DeoR/GlpR family transcriptional regulator of sugar metabolism